MYLELNDVARDVCRANIKDNCGGCPIRVACVDYTRAVTITNKDQYNQWIEYSNDLALRVVEKDAIFSK